MPASSVRRWTVSTRGTLRSSLRLGSRQRSLTLSWSVSNDVGEIDAVGLFTAKKAGEGNVIASANGQSGQASVTVAPGPLAVVHVEPPEIQLKAGESVQLTVKGLDAVGNEVALEPIWSLTADLGELSPQ